MNDLDHTTSSVQLEEYSQILNLPLIGIYSKNELPTHPSIGSYIINMEDSTAGNGSHWILLKIFPNKEVIYYDSFGLSPPRQITEFIGKKIACSNRQIQNIDATTCGYYCLACDLYMTYEPRKNVYERFDDFLNIWSVNTKKNDVILLKYLKDNGLRL
jgi:hypothetical protein